MGQSQTENSMIHTKPATGPAPLLCLGETMVLLTADEGPLEANSHVGMHAGGAESNVASGLAHMGHQVEWFSRVGADPFGRIILNALNDRDVRTQGVAIDASRPTGIYLKNRDNGTSLVYYYRTGSAASSMGPSDVAALSLEDRSICHLSGITAAISASANDLMQRLIIDRSKLGPLISFDVNYRPGLWPVDKAAPRLLELARNADIVVVGRDEAETLWGTQSAEDVRTILPPPVKLIVKDADVGATYFADNEQIFVAALTADVVEPVGAGDAFAAGFLSGFVRGFNVERALRIGHLMAGLTLQHVSDLPILPSADAILAASEVHGQAWADIRLNRGSMNSLDQLLLKRNVNAT